MPDVSLQNFYDWYLSNGAGNLHAPSPESALVRKGALFSTPLRLALKADFDAQAKVKGEIVGIDFDPFLGGQGHCERYIVGNVTPDGQHYRAEVFGICDGKKHDRPDVFAEVALRETGDGYS